MDKAPITLDLVLSALGRGINDDDLVAQFDAATLRNWPDPDADDDDPLVESYWRFGFALEFADSTSLERGWGYSGIQGALAVSAIVFYSNEEGYREWEHDLPSGLSFSMSPSEVAGVLGGPVATRAPFERRVDKFFVDQHVIDVCFDETETKIDFVSIRRKDIYESGIAKISEQSWEPFSALIGRSTADESVLTELSGILNLPINEEDIDAHENDEFHERFGVTLYSLKAKELRTSKEAPKVAGRAVSRVKFSRAGIGRSEGYSGKMPFDLQFGDGPEIVRQKMPPQTEEDGYEASGRFTCTSDGFFFHVYVSYLYWQIIAVSVFHESQAAD